MSRRAAILMCSLVACITAACGRPAASPDRDAGPSLASWIGPLDALSRRIGTVRRRLEQQGLSTARALERKFASDDRPAHWSFSRNVVGCTTIVALSGSTTGRLELVALDADGDLLGRDTADGEAGLVHTCTDPASTMDPRTYLVAELTGGAGSVAVVVFESTSTRAPNFEGLFRDIVVPASVTRDVEEALHRVRVAAREAGQTLVGGPVVGVRPVGASLRAEFRLDASRCYAFVARAGEGVTDIDAFLFDASGAEVARDLTRGAAPRLMHCATSPGMHSLELRVFEGQGAVGVIAHTARPPDEIATSPASDAPAVPVPASPEALVQGHAERTGWGAAAYVARGATIGPGESQTHQVWMAPGCSAVTSAHVGDLADVDYRLVDEAGLEIDRDVGTAGTALLVRCGSEGVAARVVATGHAQHANYAIVVQRVAASGATDVERVRAEHARALVAPTASEALRWRSAVIDPQQTWRTTTTLSAGECRVFAVGGAAAVYDVDLRLVNATGEVVASDTGPAPYAAIRHCATEDASLSLEVLAYRGGGPVALLELPVARP